MNEVTSLPNAQGCQTISVTEAGKRLGISRNVAYEAVGRGEIPSIKIGKRILVPVAALERLLSVEATLAT